MRKSMLACLCMLLLAFSLAGCGNSGGAGTGTDSAASGSAETSKPADAAASRTYKHSMGETQIPAHPEKVVTLQYVSQMMAVGIKPIGAPGYLLEDMGDKVKGIENIGNSEKVNYEKIIALQPDLIIAGDADQDMYDKLSKIAPTVAIPWMDYDMPGHVKVIGDILNRQKEAEAWQKGFDEKVKATEEQIKSLVPAGKTVAIYNVRPKELYVYGVRNFGYTIYKALNLTPPAAVQKEIDKDPNFWATSISLEKLPEFAADYVFVSTFQDDDSKKHLEDIQKSALWKNLPAVKENHVYVLNFDRWFGYTPDDVEYQLQDMVNMLKK
ncbi:UNVERIFIED_CONTAM: iron complex transport system substrate-binding protein [Brevibacillus sp. OAP136]